MNDTVSYHVYDMDLWPYGSTPFHNTINQTTIYKYDYIWCYAFGASEYIVTRRWDNKDKEKNIDMGILIFLYLI